MPSRVGILLMLLLIVPAARGPAAQISPGPLARAHQGLEGARNCTQCHGNGKDAMNGQCIACHREIGAALRRPRGYHAAPAVKLQRCASCHPDHAGSDFALLKWPDGSRDAFKHERTGWTLAQRHATATCTDCHQQKFQDASVSRLAPPGAPPAWLGLETNCTTCHDDIHRGALGDQCSSCHDAGRWQTTPGFQHDTTSYPLTDKHREVACDKCHATAKLSTGRDAAGHVIPVYRPVPFATCASCHTDPHAGGLGADCAGCHTTRGFRIVDKQRFDHQRTKYPLSGKHAAAKCAACHQAFSTPAEKKPGYASCASCHADAHNGSATLGGKPVDCGSCHTVSGFTPSSYTIAQHRTTKYPLEGRHATVTCAACHGRQSGAAATARWGTSRVVLRPVATTCRSCHADDHGTQFTSRPDRGECAACHRVTGWTPSSFDSAAHAKTRLALTARHAAVRCGACHAADRAGLPPLPATTATGPVKLLFRLPETTCAQCHQDVHRGRFATTHEGAAALDCTTCHDARSFRPSSLDVTGHRATGFPLEGAHRATSCVTCHKELGTSRRRTTALIRQTALAALSLTARTGCADCHTSPHESQFDSRHDGGRCEACHDAAAFTPAGRFDHTRDASFALTGAHERVACARCHVTAHAGGAEARMIFRPLSVRCESCHSPKGDR